jgi:L-fuculose-phosphate aldolase
MNVADTRVAVVACAQRLDRLGLNHASAGNVGLRWGDGVLVTPSGVAAADLRPDAVVRLGADGRPAPGQLRPTTEWRIHRDVLRARPDVTAVVHTHSPEATAVACLRVGLPAVHYAVARVGAASVPCAEYATYGTEELSASVLATLDAAGTSACLMANHGVLTTGADLDAALATAVEIEWVARVWRLAKSHGEPVHVLDGAEMARVVEQLRDYGQPAAERGA